MKPHLTAGPENHNMKLVKLVPFHVMITFKTQFLLGKTEFRFFKKPDLTCLKRQMLEQVNFFGKSPKSRFFHFLNIISKAFSQGKHFFIFVKKSENTLEMFTECLF